MVASYAISFYTRGYSMVSPWANALVASDAHRFAEATHASATAYRTRATWASEVKEDREAARASWVTG